MANIQKYFFLFFTSFCVCKIVAEAITRNTEVDLIIRGLEDESSLGVKEQCLEDILCILKNVKNHTLWAVYIWSSNQHPLGTLYGSKYSLGNYDQCLQASSIIGEFVIRTQYCLTNVKLTGGKAKKRFTKPNLFGSTDDFLETKLNFGSILNEITWGACVPATCNAASVAKILKVIYSVNPLASAEPEITVDTCELAEEEIIYNTGFYVFLAIMASLIVTAILSTCVHNVCYKLETESQIAYAFSLKRNWLYFYRVSNDEIPVLNFLKAVQVILTTLIHSNYFFLTAAISNNGYLDQLLAGKGLSSKMLQHIDLLGVENFFLISGILLMQNLLKKKRSPIIFLIQRYIRLIGSFAFMVFYSISVLQYTGDGPLWNKFIGLEQKACKENWFWNFLMLNNYIKDNALCHVTTWYIPCDYHLAVMGVVLYSIWQWNKRVSKFAILVAAISGLLLPGFVTYFREMPGIMLFDYEKMSDMRSNLVFLETYSKSHNRIGSYLLGLATGYIISKFSPTKYRGIISQEWSYIGCALALFVNFKVWTSAGSWCLDEYNAWNSAVYATFNRNIWTLMFCIIIGIAEYGDMKRVRSFMEWRGFVIISRLAYGIYITHWLILERNIYSQRNPMHFDIFNGIAIGIGPLILSMLCSLWLWLFVEAPLINLTNIILNHERTKQPIDEGMKTEQEENIKKAQLKSEKHL